MDTDACGERTILGRDKQIHASREMSMQLDRVLPELHRAYR